MDDTLNLIQRFYHDHIRCHMGKGACVLPSGHDGNCSMSFNGRDDLRMTYGEIERLMGLDKSKINS